MTSTPPARAVRVAYLTNQYPKTSHSFIRREILALVAAGIEVDRYAIRTVHEPLVESADREEARATRVVLGTGMMALAAVTLLTAVRRPWRFTCALRLTLAMARWSERGLVRPLAWLAEACLLLRWLERQPVTHLHAHFGTNAAAVAMLARQLGGPPYSFTAHGTESFDSPRSISLALKIQHAAFVVAVSEWGRAQLMRVCPAGQWSKLHVVRCGVDDRFLASAPVPAPSNLRIVCVARLSPEKGVDVLVAAMEQLVRTGRQGELVILGDGEARDVLAKRINDGPLHGRVQLAGWADADSVRRELHSARALIVPSFGEGLPVVIMEALALRRPVVGTAVGAVPELVRDGVTGWLVPLGSPDALAAAIAKVFDASPEHLSQMGETGARLIASRHDVAREAARLAELFRAAPQW